MTENEFFEILGYLSSPSRNTKLYIETHPRRRATLEEQYQSLTGDELEEDNINYFILQGEADKRGAELRIYFNGDIATIPTHLSDIRVGSRPGDGYQNRINNNSFVFRLIEHGFRVGNGQDYALISPLVPEDFITEFENGFSIT